MILQQQEVSDECHKEGLEKCQKEISELGINKGVEVWLEKCAAIMRGLYENHHIKCLSNTIMGL